MESIYKLTFIRAPVYHTDEYFQSIHIYVYDKSKEREKHTS